MEEERIRSVRLIRKKDALSELLTVMLEWDAGPDYEDTARFLDNLERREKALEKMLQPDRDTGRAGLAELEDSAILREIDALLKRVVLLNEKTIRQAEDMRNTYLAEAKRLRKTGRIRYINGGSGYSAAKFDKKA